MVKVIGKTANNKHLKGEKLSKAEAIHAKCFDCMGQYADGTVDCEIPMCSLYPFMPYKKNNKRER